MSKLEQVIEKKHKREAKIRERAKLVDARIASQQERKKTREIQKLLREKFTKLRRLTKTTIKDRELRFEHKGQEFYITQTVHHHEGIPTDPDSRDEDFFYISLHRREPYYGEDYTIFNVYWQPDLDVKDYTSKVIEGIDWFNKEKRR